MASVSGSNGSFSVKAYQGDSKTLLAFNFADAPSAANLAGFSIACQPPGQPAYYLYNDLRFASAAGHATVAGEPPNSTANAPIQKFRWTHVPGAAHQGIQPLQGEYTYTVTPRFFHNGLLLALDPNSSVSLPINVGPFRKGALTLGFTRGYMQSQAFVHHFGNKALLLPPGRPLTFDTSQNAGTDPATNQPFTFADEYEWMGAGARVQIFNLLGQVTSDPTLSVDVFAYDLNEPDFVTQLLALARQGRCRVILDNASLHVGTAAKPSPEDEFTTQFNAAKTGSSALLRGCFARYSHDKILIVSKNAAPTVVLTGSTNFSITGLYVNANHVLVFNDASVAAHYQQVFDESWKVLSSVPRTPSKAAAEAFAATPLATQPFTLQSATVPKMSITFSPHSNADATQILGGISNRITQESFAARGSVLFAVMQLTGSDTPVYNTLNQLHATQTLFSYGISDAPEGTSLYQPGSKGGVLVTGKPSSVTLPPPFNQVPSVPGHEIHDKFVICGLNGTDPVVYCGSSNLAGGGEQQNGDNLLEIHDEDVATAFAIEALLLVDHYSFLDRYSQPKAKPAAAPRGKAAPAAALPVPPDPETDQPPASAAARAAGRKVAASKSPRKAASHRVPPETAPRVVRRKAAPVKKAPTKKAAAKKLAVQQTALKTAAAKTSPAKQPALKRPAAKTPPAPRKTPAAKSAPAAGSPLIPGRQPASNIDAAASQNLNLYTDDSWARRYFDPGDLHFLERVLFG